MSGGPVIDQAGRQVPDALDADLERKERVGALVFHGQDLVTARGTPYFREGLRFVRLDTADFILILREPFEDDGERRMETLPYFLHIFTRELHPRLMVEWCPAHKRFRLGLFQRGEWEDDILAEPVHSAVPPSGARPN